MHHKSIYRFVALQYYEPFLQDLREAKQALHGFLKAAEKYQIEELTLPDLLEYNVAMNLRLVYKKDLIVDWDGVYSQLGGDKTSYYIPVATQAREDYIHAERIRVALQAKRDSVRLLRARLGQLRNQHRGLWIGTDRRGRAGVSLTFSKVRRRTPTSTQLASSKSLHLHRRMLQRTARDMSIMASRLDSAPLDLSGSREWINIVADSIVNAAVKVVGKVIERYFPLREYGLPTLHLWILVLSLALCEDGTAGIQLKFSKGHVSSHMDRNKIALSTQFCQNDDFFGVLRAREIAYLRKKLEDLTNMDIDDLMKQDGFALEQETVEKALMLDGCRYLRIYPGLTIKQLKSPENTKYIRAAMKGKRRFTDKSLNILDRLAKRYVHERFHLGKSYTEIANSLSNLYTRENIQNDVKRLAKATGFEEIAKRISTKNKRRE